MRLYALIALFALTSSALAANMEDHAHRSQVDGIDLIT